MEISVDKLDHHNFIEARNLLENRHSHYITAAESEIGEALDSLFAGRNRTLQRLSATFRRSDLVDMLMTNKPAQWH